MQHKTAEGFDENGWYIVLGWARNLDRHPRPIWRNCDQTREYSKLAADHLIRESVSRDSSPKTRQDNSLTLATIRWNVHCFGAQTLTCATLIPADGTVARQPKACRPRGESKPAAHPL